MKKKFLTSLTGTMAALMLVFGSAGMTAEAAEEVENAVPAQETTMPLSTDQVTEATTCSKCGGKLTETVQKRIVAGVEEKSRCRDIYHGLDCWICDVTYADKHTIFCSPCNIVYETFIDNLDVTYNYHLTIH